MSKRIEIIVDSKGQSQVETKGYAGSECVEASQFIEQALGKVESSRHTPDFFYSRAETKQQNRLSS